MIYRATIFVLSVVVLLLLTERGNGVTRVTPDAPKPKPKRAEMAIPADEDYWKQKTDNLLADVKQGRAEKNLSNRL